MRIDSCRYEDGHHHRKAVIRRRHRCYLPGTNHLGRCHLANQLHAQMGLKRGIEELLFLEAMTIKNNEKLAKRKDIRLF